MGDEFRRKHSLHHECSSDGQESIKLLKHGMLLVFQLQHLRSSVLLRISRKMIELRHIYLTQELTYNQYITSLFRLVKPYHGLLLNRIIVDHLLLGKPLYLTHCDIIVIDAEAVEKRLLADIAACIESGGPENISLALPFAVPDKCDMVRDLVDFIVCPGTKTGKMEHCECSPSIQLPTDRDIEQYLEILHDAG
jgi:hypothetical protein